MRNGQVGADSDLDHVRGTFGAKCDRYREALKSSDSKAAMQWDKRFTSSEEERCEGAIGEAVTWCYLRDHGVAATPLAPLGTTKTPDFRCAIGSNDFYVDAATIRSSMCIQKSSIVFESDESHDSVHEVNQLRVEIQRIARSKFAQLAVCETRTAIMIAMLCVEGHVWLSSDEIEEALTGPVDWIPRLDARTGRISGERLRARPNWTTFFNSDGKSTGHGLSAVFVGSFGARASRVYGMSNPHATHPWDHSLLPAPTCCI
ncbi:MAG: hypothetical protein KF838_04115 [Phycisphaeraceae bacterium]|nr:MAG: hypothetical protein KF838_04115 [Phycisphaeraceae bacterium]